MKKPIAKLVGQDGNIFNLIGIATKALRKAGMNDQADVMRQQIMMTAKSYDDALRILSDYVDIR